MTSMPISIPCSGAQKCSWNSIRESCGLEVRSIFNIDDYTVAHKTLNKEKMKLLTEGDECCLRE